MYHAERLALRHHRVGRAGEQFLRQEHQGVRGEDPAHLLQAQELRLVREAAEHVRLPQDKRRAEAHLRAQALPKGVPVRVD